MFLIVLTERKCYTEHQPRKPKIKSYGTRGIWSCHGGEYDDVVLCCDAEQTRRWITFRRNIISPSSELKNKGQNFPDKYKYNVLRCW
jgi:hypothetical protein